MVGSRFLVYLLETLKLLPIKWGLHDIYHRCKVEARGLRNPYLLPYHNTWCFVREVKKY